MERDALRDTLLEAPWYVIDFLPRQVPAQSGGRYFAVERFFTRKEELRRLYRRFACLLLKLSCYYDFSVSDGENWADGLSPEDLFDRTVACADGGDLQVLLPSQPSLITLSGGDLHLTAFRPTEELLETLRPLAQSEGLFLWQPPQRG